MAEGITNTIENIEAYSAGVKATKIDPFAIKAMSEIGIDISKQYSKSIEELPDIDFDVIVTVCDNARENCPFFLGEALRIHKSFEDPPYISKDLSSDEDKLKCYRKVRDEIKRFINNELVIKIKGGL